jgi:parallel beta-helix repeat protein
VKKIFGILLALALVLSFSLVAVPVAANGLPVHNVNKSTDYATIQTAVDDADPCDLITCDAGTYAGAIVNKDVTISGALGGGSVITSGVAYKDGSSLTTAFRLDSDADGTEINDFTINNNQGADFYFAVFARGADNVTIDSLEVNDTVQGITNWGGSGWTITNNTVIDTVAAGGGGIAIFLGATPPSYRTCSDNLVQYNVINATATAEDYSCPGICLCLDLRYGAYDGLNGTEDISGNQILNNTITASGANNGVGIEVGTILGDSEEDPDRTDPVKIAAIMAAAAVHDNMVQENTADGADMGIYFYNVTDLTITQNTIENSVGYGIYAEHGQSGTVITGNTFTDNEVQLKDETVDTGTLDPLDIATILNSKTFDRAVTVDHPGASLLHTIWSSIQDAIDAAVAGDTVNVAAGTYSEWQDVSDFGAGKSTGIMIDKSLILEGANAGIPATGARGPESIINAQEADMGVLINGEGTIATFDGFTVENYDTAGILAGAIGYWGEDPEEVHILNNIVKEPTIEAPHNNNIQVYDGTTGTIIGNEVSGALLEDPNWSGSGILVGETSDVVISDNYVHDCEGGIQTKGYAVHRDSPAEDIIIENNLVENCETGISPQGNSIGTIIRYNDVLNNDIGIGSLALDYSYEQSTPSGTQVHYNNIVGNVNYGVKSSVWFYEGTGSVTAEEVDALYNWWGNETGPSHDLNLGGQGDAVSDNVDFSPWLYKTQEQFVSGAPCYAGSVVLANEATKVDLCSYDGGWNSFSTPITLDGSADTVSELLALTTGSGLFIQRAQRWDLASQTWVPVIMGNMQAGADYQIKPGEGFFIQVSSAGSLPILVDTHLTSPPQRALTAGWNLIGMSSLRAKTVENALPGVSYDVVLSPAPPNDMGWNVPPGADVTYLQLGEAYWVAMGEPDTMWGLTTTPVADDMTWELNQ